MPITPDTKKKTRNLQLGGGLEGGDGGDYVVEIGEQEEQVTVKRDRRLCGGPARSSKLVVKNK